MVSEPVRGRWDPSIPAITEWVAVLRVADTADELDVDASSIFRRVPEHGLFGRVDAHQGLAERLRVPPGTWVSGVAADTRAGLEAALRRANEGRPDPLVVGEFRIIRLAE